MSSPAINDDRRVSELALSIAWHAGLTREVATTDGQCLKIVFPGHWTHGHGPDFRDAMIERPDGSLTTGSVELHHRSSDWVRHGHHTDPAYNDVILHIVTSDDTNETRTLAGTTVPTAILRVPEEQLRAVQMRDPAVWARFGGSVCAPALAAERPAEITSLIAALGDTRFDQRVTRFESELALAAPSDVLVPALFDAFGYTRNRDQMRLLAERAPWSAIAPRLSRLDRDTRVERVTAILLGVGSWMPLSPRHASLAGLTPGKVAALESRWREEATSWEHAMLPPTVWDTARVRPANHPASRIVTLAALLGSHGTELLPALLDGVRDGVSTEEHLMSLAQHPGTPPLGRDRAIAIAASVVLPFAAAYARSTGDDALEDSSLRGWNALPAGATAQAARRARQQVAGDTRITRLRERGNQGLLYLDRHYCGPRRCYECPIARAVVADELRRAQPTSSA